MYMKIRNLVDLLLLVETPYTAKDHVEAICEGLLDEYESFIMAMITRAGYFSAKEVEALLLFQEARIEKKTMS